MLIFCAGLFPLAFGGGNFWISPGIRYELTAYGTSVGFEDWIWCDNFTIGASAVGFTNLNTVGEAYSNLTISPTNCNVTFTSVRVGGITSFTLYAAAGTWDLTYLWIPAKPAMMIIDDAQREEGNGWNYTGTLLTLYFWHDTAVTVSMYDTVFSGASQGVPTTYYMRNDTIVENGVAGYYLATSQTVTANEVNDSSLDLSGRLGVRVYVMGNGGTIDYELTGGSPRAQVIRDQNGSGLQWAQWWCPGIQLGYGFDSLKVNVYFRFGSGAWALKETFTTYNISSSVLYDSYWNFTYATSYARGGSTVWSFLFGNSTSNSLVSNVCLQATSTWDLTGYNMAVGNFFTVMMLPFTSISATVANIVYGIIFLILVVPLYFRYHSILPIVVLSVLFAGTGGFLSGLVPGSGLALASLVLGVFGIGGAVLYRVFR